MNIWLNFHLDCNYKRALADNFCNHSLNFLHPFSSCFQTLTFLVTFLNSFGKNPIICSTGLETGCKPVLLIFETRAMQLPGRNGMPAIRIITVFLMQHHNVGGKFQKSFFNQLIVVDSQLFLPDIRRLECFALS